MNPKGKILLEDVYKKLVYFLNKEEFEYVIIGGVAAGILGEPRITADIDIDIVLDKNNIGEFLKIIKKAGFNINEQRCKNRAKEVGVFEISYGDFHIDFIIASTDLEKEIFKRKKVIKFYGLRAFFPTPEDFILLKVVPGRTQDISDIEKVAMRYKDKLDAKYIMTWAQKLSDEAEDMRIYNEIKRLLIVKRRVER